MIAKSDGIHSTLLRKCFNYGKGKNLGDLLNNLAMGFY